MNFDNGVTRREFDRLEAQVNMLVREGTPKGIAARALVEERLKVLADDIHSLDRRIGSLVRIMGSIALTLFTGLITLLVILIQMITD